MATRWSLLGGKRHSRARCARERAEWAQREVGSCPSVLRRRPDRAPAPDPREALNPVRCAAERAQAPPPSSPADPGVTAPRAGERVRPQHYGRPRGARDVPPELAGAVGRPRADPRRERGVRVSRAVGRAQRGDAIPVQVIICPLSLAGMVRTSPLVDGEPAGGRAVEVGALNRTTGVPPSQGDRRSPFPSGATGHPDAAVDGNPREDAASLTVLGPIRGLPAARWQQPESDALLGVEGRFQYDFSASSFQAGCPRVRVSSPAPPPLGCRPVVVVSRAVVSQQRGSSRGHEPGSR